MQFELKFSEAKMVLKHSRIYLKHLEFSEIHETWSKILSLHLVSFNITYK
jgi:hypothetical protein